LRGQIPGKGFLPGFQSNKIATTPNQEGEEKGKEPAARRHDPANIKKCQRGKDQQKTRKTVKTKPLWTIIQTEGALAAGRRTRSGQRFGPVNKEIECSIFQGLKKKASK